MYNPLDGGWEYLSHRQWRLLKLRIPKQQHKLIDDWMLSILEGPESAVAFAFDLRKEHHRATILWLSHQYSVFNIKTAQQLYRWSQWILGLYPLDKMHGLFNKAAARAEKLAELERLRECLISSLVEESGSSTKRRKKSR